jgi:hypothetical protein
MARDAETVRNARILIKLCSGKTTIYDMTWCACKPKHTVQLKVSERFGSASVKRGTYLQAWCDIVHHDCVSAHRARKLDAELRDPQLRVCSAAMVEPTTYACKPLKLIRYGFHSLENDCMFDGLDFQSVGLSNITACAMHKQVRGDMPS